jgi:hypothetical protein
MPVIRITTSQGEVAAEFQVKANEMDKCIAKLRDPNEVLEFNHPAGGTAYIPVRNITYVLVTAH